MLARLAQLLHEVALCTSRTTVNDAVRQQLHRLQSTVEGQDFDVIERQQLQDQLTAVTTTLNR